MKKIFLVLLVTVCVTLVTSSGTFFYTVDEGTSVFGEIEAEFRARSGRECSLRCLDDRSCKIFKHHHNGTDQGNCILIHSVCSSGAGQTFQEDDNTIIYERDGSWTAPLGWTGPDPVLYQSFDDSSLTLMEGTQPRSTAPLVSGQVNCAWTLARSKGQWIDLGIHTETCMTRPETCGAAGGAISLWINAAVDCSGFCGVLSSYKDGATGFEIFLSSTNIRYHVLLSDGKFIIGTNKQSGWIHIVLDYIGPSDGIRLFYDAQEVKSDAVKDTASVPSGDARIVVGRRYTAIDAHYGNVKIDELIFFNGSLRSEDVQLIYNSM